MGGSPGFCSSPMIPTDFLFPGYAPGKLLRKHGREKLVLEIEKRAFDAFLPLLAKPRLELEVWPYRKGPALSLSGGKSFPRISLQKGDRRGM